MINVQDERKIRKEAVEEFEHINIESIIPFEEIKRNCKTKTINPTKDNGASSVGVVIPTTANTSTLLKPLDNKTTTTAPVTMENISIQQPENLVVNKTNTTVPVIVTSGSTIQSENPVIFKSIENKINPTDLFQSSTHKNTKQLPDIPPILMKSSKLEKTKIPE